VRQHLRSPLGFASCILWHWICLKHGEITYFAILWLKELSNEKEVVGRVDGRSDTKSERDAKVPVLEQNTAERTEA
jgi:hypothetical protein